MSSVSNWKKILRTNFLKWQELASFLELTSEQQELIHIKPTFLLNVPRRLAEKMAKQDLNDPILKQFLPMKQEMQPINGFVSDPVGDLVSRCSAKLLHKYKGRALLLCTSACAMHCRYCFRQNFPYETSDSSFEPELEKIAADNSIHEVILSGGDPLSLSDEVLGRLFDRLNNIPHIKRLRVHSRFVMGIPERVDGNFLNILSRLNKQIWFVIHANHAREFDEDIWSALETLRKTGAVVLNQAVLLRGVNDDVQTLKSLCETLVDHGVFPYYLHQLDRVNGAAHFEVLEEKGLTLIEELRKQLSGYAVPLYVREISGEPSKTPL